jgi:UDP-N-acetylglucosamine pyrophosphorylase
LGATVDLNILNLLLNQKNGSAKPNEFLMEVTDKTRADVKVGKSEYSL